MPFKPLIDWFTYSLLGLDASTTLAESLNFFIYDSIKIVLLLFVMISFISFLRSHIPPEKIKRTLGKKRYGASNLGASLFGAITPFCSCSSIPIFLSFIRAGVPLGTSFSFLITSPLVNEYLAVIMFALFGWKITVLYIISGIAIGTISGMILGRMNLEKYIVRDIENTKTEKHSFGSIRDRAIYGVNEAKDIVKKLWLWIFVGVGIGAMIHNYIPPEMINGVSNSAGIFSVPLAVIIGVPVYANCAAIVPVAVALFQKGLSLGTALAFMMSTSALSFPEAVILRRAMKLKLIAIFFGVVTMGIIITGFVFNALSFFDMIL